MSALETLFTDLPRLPSMPRVVQDLIASLCEEDIDLATLVAQVKLDQSLSLRVLAMANSGAFGSGRRIGAIDQAVSLIGLNALRSLVIASGISRTFARVEGLDMPAFWRQAMICAGVAREFGKHQGVNREFAYTAGLMHRVGLILLHLAWPAKAQQLPEGATGGATLVQERTLFGLDHCEAGSALAQRWHFPDTIADALRWQAEPLASEAGPLAAVLHLAAAVTRGLLAGDDAEKISVLLEPAVLARLSLNRAEAERRIAACVDLPASVQLLLD